MRYLGVILALLLCGLAACGQPTAHSDPATPSVSADFVTTDPASPEPIASGRIYLGEASMRIESAAEDYTEIAIYDFARNVVIVLEPNDRIYTEAAWPGDRFDFSVWLVLGDGDPCGAIPNEPIRAKRLGSETLHGRPVEKWHCAEVGADEDNRTFTLWRDPSLPLAFVRLESGEGVIVNLYNIRLGSQSADLFQVPPGYTKRDPLEGTVIQVAPGDTKAVPPGSLVIQVLPD